MGIIQLESSSPYYQQLQDIIKKLIAKSEIGLGEPLPSERELCRQYSLSRLTVRRAISELVTEGILIRKQGVGTFVRNLQIAPVGKYHTKIIMASFYPMHILKTDPYYSCLMRGIQSEMAGRDYALSIISGNGTTIENNLRKDNKLEGFILLGIEDNHPVSNLKGVGVPFICVDYAIQDKSMSHICVDNKTGAYEATKYLIQLGHRRIGFVNSLTKHPNFRERLQGYRDALDEAEIKYDETLIGEGDSWTNGGYVVMKAFLQLSNRPTAVLAATDRLAISVMEAIREEGLNIPADISIIGFGAIDTETISKPPLTSIDLFPEKIGQTAARELLKLIKSPDTMPVRMTLPVRLVKKESCSKRRKGL